MLKLLSIPLLCLALAPALAADAPHAEAHAAPIATAAQGGYVRASLIPAANAATPAQRQAAGDAPAPAKSTIDTAADTTDKDGSGNDRTSLGMLLGALALMLGIVLRRWGTGPQ